MFYLTTPSTHFIYGYMASTYGKEPFRQRERGRKEGRKEENVLFNDALNTFYLRLKDHSDSERKPAVPTTWATFSD